MNSFMGTQFSNTVVDGKVHLIGFPFDGTACFRKGAVKGPWAVREISGGIETYSPYLDLDLDNFDIVDLGDLNSETDWQANTDQYLTMIPQIGNSKFLMVGGEHSVPYCQIKRYLQAYDNLTVLHLDAHADLRDGYEGYHYSHASIIRRVLDDFDKNHSLIQYGIRSGTKEEFQYMEENQTLCKSRQEFLEAVDNIQTPIYLTLDVDFFDPAYFPGTGTPEAGGEDFHCFVSLMKILKSKNIVGADVCELAPDIDPTGNSSVFCAKLIRELLLVLSITK